MTTPVSASHDARYTVWPADLQADRNQVLALWRDNPLQPARVEDKYRWFYIDNPNGPTRLLLLRHGPACVGAAGMVTRRFLARGKALSAGLLTDLYVAGDHRSVMPALMLQRQMRTLGLELHDLLYGYPNDKSLPIVRRLGYREIGQGIGKYVMPLRYAAYLERRLPGGLSRLAGALLDRLVPLYFTPYKALLGRWHGAWLETFDERFDALWQRACAHEGVIGVRDKQFLSWRFCARPSHHYRIFALSRQPGGDLEAYAVCEALAEVFHIRDLLVSPQSPDALRVLVHRLARHAHAQGFVRLSFECMASPSFASTLRGAGLFERERMPIVVHVPAATEATIGGLDWYLTAADTEL
ncbi:MAG: GNAT family N-acetyltransferase [Rhizobacter sp.]|nr:GNAT family N-acetyltransferase [Rhizobacter sp.]